MRGFLVRDGAAVSRGGDSGTLSAFDHGETGNGWHAALEA